MAVPANPEISQARNESEIEQFIRFSWEVYGDNPVWVPPVLGATKDFLLGKGVFFEHCRHRLFVAKESSKTVATIAAFYDRNLVDHWKQPLGLLGFFEALPGKDAAVQRLFEEAESYLREQGAGIFLAPVNGGIANPAGLLANAYNYAPVCLMNYNPSYYHSYFRKSGYKPEKELMAFTMDLLDGKVSRKIDYLMRHTEGSGIRIRKFHKKTFREDCYTLAGIYSSTFNRHWGYSPASAEEVYEILAPLRIVLEEDFIVFAEYEGKTVGFVLGLPNYNSVVQKLSGDMGLIGALRFLRLKKGIREGRIVAIGTVPEWRGKKVVPLLMAHVYSSMIAKGYTTCENSWILKENVSSQNAVKKFRSFPQKSYFVYQKTVAA